MEIAHDTVGSADDLRFEKIDLAEIDLPELPRGDVLMRVHCPKVSPHASPILRGAAYLAALKGDPWRPQM